MKENVNSSLSGRSRETEILEASLKVFARFGYGKTTLEDVAGTLGLSPQALYRYVKNKRDLYLRTVERGFHLWQEAALKAASEGETPLEAFRGACLSAFRYLAENPDLGRIIRQDPDLFPLFEKDDPFGEINRSSVQLLVDLIRKGMEAGVFSVPDPLASARVLFSLYSVFIQKAYVAGEEETELFERGLDLVLNGLRAR